LYYCGYSGRFSSIKIKGDEYGMIAALIIVIAIVLIVFGIKTGIKSNKEFSEKLKATGFIESKCVVANGNTLSVDDVSKQWYLKTAKDIYPKIYKYADLNEFEVYEDGESIAKGRAGSALVGGLLFGVVGAVVGGSRSKKSNNICSVLQLRVRVNDLQNPEKIINFISTKIKKDSSIYKTNSEKAKNMAATLSFILNQAQSQAV